MKSVISVLVALCVASPAAAFEWQFKDNTSYDQTNLVGRYSAQITHNGEATSGNTGEVDQTTYAGSRGDIVQGVQASQGRGRVNSDK